jgi:hypothetical protein
MLESGSSGSVRGVPSNGHPYRDPGSGAAVPSLAAHSRSYVNRGRTITQANPSRSAMTCPFGIDHLLPRLSTWDSASARPGRARAG